MTSATRAYLAEFVGTFALVFMGTAVATLQGGLFKADYGATGWLGIAMAFGGTLMVLVWTIGPVSGCHINPAVSIPMALSGRLPMARLPGYIVAQCAGAIVASLVLRALLSGMPTYEVGIHGLGANGNPQNMSLGAMFGWEAIMTALFLLTIFTVTHRNAPVGFAALAIGGYLFMAHLVGVPLGDSSLNPARSLGPAVVVGEDALKILWVFIVAPIVGGLIGWQVFNALHGEEPQM
ncbi:MAG TPA: aquaporin [Pirellulales bacterium]|jgi:aquaporin Z|nr:aquaporin [Pirellulales bacterium]